MTELGMKKEWNIGEKWRMKERKNKNTKDEKAEERENERTR